MKRLDDEASLSELIRFIENEYDGPHTREAKQMFSVVAGALVRYRILLRHVDALEKAVVELAETRDFEVLIERMTKALGSQQ